MSNQWHIAGPYQEQHQGKPRYRIRITTPSGKKLYKTRVSCLEAQALIDVMWQEIATLSTLQEPFKKYKQYLELKGNKASSVFHTMTRLKRWLPPETMVSDLTPAWVEARYLERVNKVVPGTHRNELIEVKTFFAWLVSQDIIKQNPASQVKPVGRINKGKKQLHRSEAALFSSLALSLAKAGDQAATGCLLALWLGLRSSEISNLRVRDLDIQPNTAWLWIEGDVKTDASNRHLDITGLLVDVLKNVANGRPGYEVLFKADTSDGRHTRDWLRKKTRKICLKASVPVVCPHGLRGTHATIAESAGATCNVVMAALGHTSHRVTEQHYLAPGTTEQAKAKQFESMMDAREKVEE